MSDSEVGEVVDGPADKDVDYRDAGSGRFVTEKYAVEHPDTTVAERNDTPSQRAVEAFDSLPADSEHSVDYDGDPAWTTIEGQLAGQPTLFGGYELPPSVEVEVVITTPDGHRFVFHESHEYSVEQLDENDAADFEQHALVLFEDVSGSVRARLGD